MHFFAREKSFYKTLFFLAIPMILQSLISVGVGIADNIMVGSLGEMAIGGVSLANQVQNVMHLLLLGVSASITLLAAQYWGKGDTKSIKNIVSIGLKVCLIIGLSIGIVVFFFPEQVLAIFTNERDVIREGSKYLKIMALSYFFFCVTNTFIAAMRCVETVNIALVISISTLCVDIGLNYILIFGKLGFPALGIRGAAIATLICRIIECGIITVYVRFYDQKLKIRFHELLETNKQLLKDFFVYGFPVMIGDILWGIGGAAQASIVGRLGSAAIAANSIALVLFSFVTVVVFGISGAAAVIIGKTVGSGDYDRAKQYARTLQVIFALLGACTSLTLFGLRDFFITFYNISEPAKLLTKQFISILCITVLGTSYHAPTFTGIIRAGGDTKFVLIVDFLFIWAFVMPLSYLAAFVWQLPPAIVFLCLKSDQCIKWVIAIIKVNSYTWIRNLTRPLNNPAE